MRTLILQIALMIPVLGTCQEFAGPNQSACSTTGAVLGIGNPDPNHCYLWAVADGLTEDRVNDPNPLVQPRETTIYTVTVTDQDFSFKAVDRCTVTVDFGGLKINPPYTEPDDDPNQAQATLTINGNAALGIGPAPVLWSIEGDPDDTGCLINGNGVISNCSGPGEVTVRATNADNPSCYAEEVFKVNCGVSDLVARDLTNPGREARSGDTLYLVGSGEVQFEAIPNLPASFPPGQPQWSGDLTPLVPNANIWDEDVNIFLYNVSVCEDTVTVWRQPPSTLQTALQVDLSSIREVKSMLENYIPGISLSNPICADIPFNINTPGAVAFVYAEQLVPKYKDPNLDMKQEVRVDVPAIGVSGCVPLPCCTVVFSAGPAPGAASLVVYAFVKASSGIVFQIDVVSDPSSADDSWDGLTQLNGEIRLGAGIAASVQFGPAGIVGAAEAFTTIEGRARINAGRLETQKKWGGLQIQYTGLGYLGTPGNFTFQIPVQAGPYMLLDGDQTEWSLIYSFD